MNETNAYTVAGGGDTEAALTALGLESGIDWISSGGGAMLYYLANATLPFLEATR
jgi:phosphoglycerate kinase